MALTTFAMSTIPLASRSTWTSLVKRERQVSASDTQPKSWGLLFEIWLCQLFGNNLGKFLQRSRLKRFNSVGFSCWHSFCGGQCLGGTKMLAGLPATSGGHELLLQGLRLTRDYSRSGRGDIDHGNNITDNPDTFARRRLTDMAVQLWVGLLS